MKSKSWSRAFRSVIAACAGVGVLFVATVGNVAHAAPRNNEGLRPVKAISSVYMTIDTPQGPARFPVYLSDDWAVPQPKIERAVIVIHGKLRNADTYFRTAVKAREAAGVDPSSVLLIAPQFLATIDTHGGDVADDVLRWRGNAWMAGDDAVGGAPISSYAVLDAMVARLADRQRFPNLKHIVIAGHSGGAQVVQRYAIAAHGTPALAREGIDVRYVVANPSSYAYFDDKRPDAQGVAVPFDGAACPSFDTWKFGMQGRPPYVADRTPTQLEAGYMAKRIDYLIGGDDTNPAQAALDKTCAAEAQGSQRMARGTAYFAYLQSRHPEMRTQHFHVIPGVGHEGSKMLTSACAQAAMFGTTACRN